MADEIETKRGPGRPKSAVIEAIKRPDAIDTPVEKPAVKRTHVTMKRNPEQFPTPPYTANVHVDEIANWAKYGWEVVAD